MAAVRGSQAYYYPLIAQKLGAMVAATEVPVFVGGGYSLDFNFGLTPRLAKVHWLPRPIDCLIQKKALWYCRSCTVHRSVFGFFPT